MCADLVLRGPLVYRSLPDGTPCVSSTAYRGPVPALVLAAKEAGRRDTRDVLAHALAAAVVEVGWAAARRAPTLLAVTPPTGMLTRWRRRGDPVADLAGTAVALVRRSGADVRVESLLRRRRPVRDQTGLGPQDRWRNVSRAFVARSVPSRRTVGAAEVDVVVVDDVLTTGATAAEAVAASRDAGWRVIGVATVASAGRHSGSGLFGRSAPTRGDDTPGTVHVCRPVT